MHQPDLHPNLRPDTAGRGSRFVIRTSAVRPIRFDHQSDTSLLWAKVQLAAAHNPKDQASCSLVVRRAVRLYERFLCRLLAEGGLEAERKAVRQLSVLPGPKRKRRKREVQPREQAYA